MRKFTLIALALLAVVACNKEENKGAKHISVDAGIGEMTKVAYDGNKAAFVAGDDLAFFAWTGDKTVIPEKLVVNNVTNTLNTDGLWVHGCLADPCRRILHGRSLHSGSRCCEIPGE